MVDFTRSSTRRPGGVERLGHVEHRLQGLRRQAFGQHAVGVVADLSGHVHDRGATGGGRVAVAQGGVGAGDVVEGDGHALRMRRHR